MSKRWTAKCWMGSSSGYVDIEVSASTSYGAKEQLQNIYGAQQIINLREVKDGGSSLDFSSSAGTAWLVGFVGVVALFLYFTPWVLMTLYGGGSTWIAQKLTGQTLEDYTETPSEYTTSGEHKKAAIVISSALLFGMIGFIQGTSLNSHFNKEYNLDGKQTRVEEVRQQTNGR